MPEKSLLLETRVLRKVQVHSWLGGRGCRRVLTGFLFMSAFSCIGHARDISSRRLLEVADFSGIMASPDGAHVAFRIEQASVEHNAYESAWYVQALDGASPPLRVADGGVPLREQAGLTLPALAAWSPDGRWIYYRALLEGKIDVWRAATDGSRAEPLTHDSADVRSFRLSTDGRELIYSVGASREAIAMAEQAEYDQGIRIDRTVPLGQGLFRSGFVDGRLATQRLRDNEVIRYPLLADVSDHWKSVELATGKQRDLAVADIPPPPLSASDLALASADIRTLLQEPGGHRIALLTRIGERDGRRDRPGVALSVVADAHSRKPIACVAEACTGKAISAVQWRPGTDEVMFTVDEPDRGHTQAIHRWNVKTGEVHPVVHANGLLNGGVRLLPSDCGITSAFLACVIAEAGRPPWLERVRIDTGERMPLFDPNPALTSDMAKTPVQLLQWTDVKGRRFSGQFYPARRSGDALPPLLVSYYWCKGFVRGGLGEELPFAALAANGISALCINLVPIEEEGAARYAQGRSAVESAIELLASAGEIDRARVGMGGLSFGAEITMWTAMHSRLLKASSVSSLGLSPLYYLLLSNFGDAFYKRLYMGWQLRSPEETPQRWQQFSPVFNLANIDAPMLMQLPEQEYIHSLDYAIPLMREGKADMYVFPNEPHQKFQPRHKLAVYERNLDWFRFWLQDYEDPDLAKRAQYVHWRDMRSRQGKAS